MVLIADIGEAFLQTEIKEQAWDVFMVKRRADGASPKSSAWRMEDDTGLFRKHVKLIYAHDDILEPSEEHTWRT